MSWAFTYRHETGLRKSIRDWLYLQKSPEEAWEQCTRGDWMAEMTGLLMASPQDEAHVAAVRAASIGARYALENYPVEELVTAMGEVDRWVLCGGSVAQVLQRVSSVAGSLDRDLLRVDVRRPETIYSALRLSGMRHAAQSVGAVLGASEAVSRSFVAHLAYTAVSHAAVTACTVAPPVAVQDAKARALRWCAAAICRTIPEWPRMVTSRIRHEVCA